MAFFGYGISDAENEVLRLRLKAARQAAHDIKKLMQQTRMNPEIREKIMTELEWISDYNAAQRKMRDRLYDEQEKK